MRRLVAVADDRLADDADALADLGAAPAGQLLVEQVLVDALALGAAVVLGPGHAEPAPLAQGGHEGAALGGVDDLGHVLPGQVEDVGVVVGIEEGLDLLDEGQLLRRRTRSPLPASSSNLTGRQISCGSLIGHRLRAPSWPGTGDLLITCDGGASRGPLTPVAGGLVHSPRGTGGAGSLCASACAFFVLGVLLVAFVAYQLWGTALYEAQAQSHLKSELAQQLHTTTGRCPPTLTASQTPRAAPALATGHDRLRPRGARQPDGVVDRQPGRAVGLCRSPDRDLRRHRQGVGEAQLEQGPGHYPGTSLPGEAATSPSPATARRTPTPSTTSTRCRRATTSTS